MERGGEGEAPGESWHFQTIISVDPFKGLMSFLASGFLAFSLFQQNTVASEWEDKQEEVGRGDSGQRARMTDIISANDESLACVQWLPMGQHQIENRMTYIPALFSTLRYLSLTHPSLE